MSENKMYQNVVFELTNGRLVVAVVPAFCQAGESIAIREVRVTEPKELPEGCTFDELVNDEFGIVRKDAR